MTRDALLFSGLALALVLAVFGALMLGAQPISLHTALTEPASLDASILIHARLPRVLLAALAGAGLSVVGVAFQGLLRNPLADPYVLGVSGGAAVGATVALLLGLTSYSLAGASLLPLSALAGGLGATFLVYFIARSGGRVSSTSIVLAGVIVNAVASALITFTKTLVSAEKAQELLFWLMGFIDVPAAVELAAASVWVALGVTLLFLDSGRLNLLALGAECASHLGVHVKGVERRVFFASSCVVGAIVSLTGLIGFVGLIVPHATRRLVGSDHRRVMPASLFVGAITLVLCDLLTRLAFAVLGTEPPVGAVTALLGGPAFLVLLRRTRDRALLV